MTPQEKASKLIYIFMTKINSKLTGNQIVDIKFQINLAKENALILINEIIDLGLLYGEAPFGDDGKQFYSFWLKVKQEIEKY